MQLEAIKVVLFDTFGTLVDWRGSIASLGQRLATEKGINGVDWDAFARAWRARYGAGTVGTAAVDTARRYPQ